MSFLGFLGAIAPPLISGLLGRKKQKREVYAQSVDYQKMVNEASAAGFNPLTALRNGGSAGFQVTHAPVLSRSSHMANAIADAVGAGLGALTQNETEKIREDRARVENEIAKEQLKAIQSRNERAPRGSLSTVPTWGAPTVKRYQKPALSKMSSGAPGIPERQETTVTNPHKEYLVDPSHADTEHIETRYGEPGDWVGGIKTGIVDFHHNLKRNKLYGPAYRKITDAASSSSKFLDTWEKKFWKSIPKPPKKWPKPKAGGW